MKWIKCSEETPTHDDKVIVLFSNGDKDVDRWDLEFNHWMHLRHDTRKIIAWMSFDALPSAPNEEKEKAEQEAAKKRAAAIEAGRAIVGAINSEYVILGTEKHTRYNMDDTSDTTVSETVVLAFSGHKVRNRAELATAAANCEKTAHLTADDYDNYYSQLGSNYNGWSVYKQQLDARGIENVYISAAEGRYFVKELPSCTEQSNIPAGSARIVYNAAQNGIEIHHPAKPAQSVIDAIKAAGFRWSKFSKCWSKKDSSYAREVAARYGELPSNLPSSGGGDGHDEMILDQIAARIEA